MNKLAVSYIEKGVAIAEKEREKIKSIIDEYLDPDVYTNKKKRDRYFELHNSGFDLCKHTSALVDIEIAISQLKNHLFMLNRQY